MIPLRKNPALAYPRISLIRKKLSVAIQDKVKYYPDQQTCFRALFFFVFK